MAVTQIFKNRKALSLYQVIDKLEVGIVLKGWEVKSMKSGHVNMAGAYIAYSPSGELWLRDAVLSPWKSAGDVGKEDQERPKKLLASRRQIDKIGSQSQQSGYTLIPLEVYVNEKGLVKLLIALVKGKKQFERKQSIKERDMQRQLDRDIKDYGL